MVCSGVEPGVAGWKAQTNPLSYGSTPRQNSFTASIPSVGQQWTIGKPQKLTCVVWEEYDDDDDDDDQPLANISKCFK